MKKFMFIQEELNHQHNKNKGEEEDIFQNQFKKIIKDQQEEDM